MDTDTHRHSTTFKTKIHIMTDMKITICGNIIDSERVAVQTGLQRKNVERTYIKNEYGKDKSKVLKVLGYGSVCTEAELTPDELLLAIAIVKTLRDYNGS